MKIAILGFGREGRSILKFLQNRGLTRKRNAPACRQAGIDADDEIWILDKNPKIKSPSHHSRPIGRGSPLWGGASSLHISHRLGKDYLKNLSQFDVIYRSPGIPYTLPQLYRARCDGTVVTSATKLFFEEIQGSKLKTPPSLKLRRASKNPIIIGITGTKGKGTTSSLLAHILKKSGKHVILAGNIGKPMLDILPQTTRADYIILELSSFQLQDLPYSPDIAVVVDVFPDHQDAHKSLREYYGSKANIGRWQKKTDVIFYFADNPISKSIAMKSPARKIGVTPKENNLKKNYEMAAVIASYLKCPEKIIEKTIKNFKGLEYRLETTRIMKIFPRKSASSPRQSAIQWINDSAASNPGATIAAIETLVQSDNSKMKKVKWNKKKLNPLSPVTFPMSLILIAGGKDKNLDYRSLAQAIRNSPQVKKVILYGENKNIINKQLTTNNLKLKTALVKDLKSAVKMAYQTAKKLINPDAGSGSRFLYPKIKMGHRDSSTDQLITILFSPASASFDMFKNYEERGLAFKKLVKTLK